MPAYALNLLDLPVDIIRLIIAPLITSSQPILICPCADPPLTPVPPLSILLVHPALHSVASPLLYSSHNHFVLDLTSPHYKHIHRALKAGVSPLHIFPQAALRRITTLRFCLAQVRGWVVDDIVPLLADMVVCGQLINLHVELQRPRDTKAVTVAALEARPLLALLADPYLHTSTLRLDWWHAVDWCRYHSGSCCHDKEAPLNGRDMVDVDWRSIIRDIDPEGREVAMGWADGDAFRRG